ncbi:MAG: hypothetical protein JO235_15135 [Chroococcidiopsidaceae cyanobacterium CP_BM_RX_35]|nr:hypothetical protein [Chroococcidiopsidaceae cyanobacterium CP_BM_RX_35]
MGCHTRKWASGLLLVVGLMLCLFLMGGTKAPALASIHTYPESPTQVMYRFQQSLRDASNQALPLCVSNTATLNVFPLIQFLV